MSGCKKTIAYSGNTTNLHQHTEKWHPHLHKQGSRSNESGPSTQATLDEIVQKPVTKLPPGSKHAQKITRTMAEFIARDMRPVALVEGKGFVKLIETLEPSYRIPSRKTIMKELVAMETEVKCAVAADMEKARYVSLTTEFWTSVANDSYLGITAHFVTPNWELMSYVLQTREVEERHTAVNVAHLLQATAEEWKITKKLAAITTDNAPNMINAVAIELQWEHIGCFAHTLQIAIKAGLGLPAVTEVLSQYRKIAGRFHRSTVAQNALEMTQTEFNLPKKKLKQEVHTRWSSTFEMLSSIVEQQQAISSALASSKKASDRDMIPTSTDLRKVGYLIKVLDPLQHATRLLCSEKTPTLSIVQPLVTALLRKHLETTDDDPELVLDLKSTIATSLRSHFSGSHQTQIRLLASVLDPRYKDLRFLPSSEHIKIYNDLQIVVSTFHHDSDEPLEDYPPPKGQGLLDFSEASDSNGDSPTEPSGQVEKEINVYRAEESIDKSEDPLFGGVLIPTDSSI